MVHESCKSFMELYRDRYRVLLSGTVSYRVIRQTTLSYRVVRSGTEESYGICAEFVQSYLEWYCVVH